MILKNLIETDFINYKKTCMTLEFPYCSFKCNKEYGNTICHNSSIIELPDIDVNVDSIIDRYLNNPLTQAVVMQGLEPMDSFNDVTEFIGKFRCRCTDDIVIYTGYTKCEIKEEIDILKKWNNIIIKFGRFVPNQEKHYDEVLGVELASNNQYAEKIS